MHVRASLCVQGEEASSAGGSTVRVTRAKAKKIKSVQNPKLHQPKESDSRQKQTECCYFKVNQKECSAAV